MRAWEGETAHRQSVERRELTIYGANSILGRFCSFVFVLAALGLAGYSASLGYPLAGVAIAGLTIGAVVVALTKVTKDSSG